MKADLFDVVCLIMVILCGRSEPAPALGPVTDGTGHWSPFAERAEVTIARAPPPGSYRAIFAKDWSSYPDEVALVGIIGVNGQTNTLQPVLPVTDFFDLVPDPLFGKVLRYLGGPSLNTYPVLLTALAPGAAGNAYRLETSPATHGGRFRKWTIKNHATSPTVTEVYDNLDRKTIEARINGISRLVRVGPMNTGYTLLPGGPNPPNTQRNTYVFSGGSSGVAARLRMVDNVQGRTASHTQLFGSLPLTHIWTRNFVRFSSNWTPVSQTGGEGGPSHKLIFLRYVRAGRHEWTLDGERGMWHSIGGPGPALEQGLLPINNVVSLNKQYGLGSAYFHPDAWPMIKAAPRPPLPGGSGNGEWYEIVLHHKTVAERGDGTMYWRQYTARGVPNPQPWKIYGYYKVLASGKVWPPVRKYEMGVNRNRQWDEAMHIDWGPYEIVDGSKYPNPWGLPGG